MVPLIVVPIADDNINDGSDKLMPTTILVMVLTTMHLINLSIRSFNDGGCCCCGVQTGNIPGPPCCRIFVVVIVVVVGSNLENYSGTSLLLRI